MYPDIGVELWGNNFTILFLINISNLFTLLIFRPIIVVIWYYRQIGAKML